MGTWSSMGQGVGKVGLSLWASHWARLLSQPHLYPRTHHLLRAVITLLVGPVQRELFVVHCVAGIECAGQAGIRAIEHIEGSRYCDFHVLPWWHCGQSQKLVRILADSAMQGASLLCLVGSGAELGQWALSLTAEINHLMGWGGQSS